LEPVMILFLGLTIGFILVAMYLPIFSIGKAVG
jgi:type IV pilus assembly protein PilC